MERGVREPGRVANEPLAIDLVGLDGLRIEAASVDPSNGIIEVDLVNDTDSGLVAWTLRVRRPGDDVPLSEVTTDVYPSLLAERTGWLKIGGTGGVLSPGDVRRIHVPIDARPFLEDRRRLEVQLAAAVFQDLTTVGAPTMTEQIFERRARDYEVDQRLLERLKRLQGEPEATLAAELGVLVQDLRQVTGAKEMAAKSRVTELGQSLDDVEAGRAGPNEAIADLLHTIRLRLEVARDSLPERMREEMRQEARREDASSQFLRRSSTYQCDDVSASRTLSDGHSEQVAWTSASEADAWLALDRDGNGSIDHGGELFGSFTDQPSSEEPNGYAALALFDEPSHGGDGNGLLTAADDVFSLLRLWIDSNHDGVSTVDELRRLHEVGVQSLQLEPVEARRRDAHGNEFRYTALVRLDRGTTVSTDVFLQTAP